MPDDSREKAFREIERARRAIEAVAHTHQAQVAGALGEAKARMEEARRRIEAQLKRPRRGGPRRDGPDSAGPDAPVPVKPNHPSTLSGGAAASPDQ